MSYFVFFYYNHFFFYNQFENLIAVRESVSEAIYKIRMITFTVLQSINCQNFVNTINIYMLTQPKGVKKFTMCMRK